MAAPTATSGAALAPVTLPTRPADALFQLVKPGGAVANFTLADLKKLPLATIMQGGKPQEGPTLLDVLKAAGVTDFQRVTLTGAGTMIFAKDQVTSQVILDFANRGTMKLASPDLPLPSPVQDITLITVE